MIHFACDSCRRVKALNEIWVLGLAAETVGVAAARREVTILPVWDRDQAVHRLAVHFCSEECKDKYVAKLFGQENSRTEGARRGVGKRLSGATAIRRKKIDDAGKKLHEILS